MITQAQAELIQSIKDCLEAGYTEEAKQTIREQIEDCFKDFSWTKSLGLPKRPETKEYLRQLKRLYNK